VFDFVAELALSGHEPSSNTADDSTEESSGGPEPVAVLTARAREFKFALELNDDDTVVRAFRSAGRRRGVMGADWGVSTERVFYGSLHEWLFQDFKAWRKFANFELLAASLGDLAVPSDRNTNYERRRNPARKASPPRREYVFVGDTGEMDREAGELMLSRHPQLTRTVFLHCVSPSPTGDDVYVPVDYAVGAGSPPGRVYHFRTYVGAAAKAVKAGLIDKAAFERVAQAALRDLNDRGVTSEASDPRNQRRDVLRDIAWARANLEDSKKMRDDRDGTGGGANANRGVLANVGTPRFFFPKFFSDAFGGGGSGSAAAATSSSGGDAAAASLVHADLGGMGYPLRSTTDEDGWCYNRDYRCTTPWYEHPVASFFVRSSTRPRRSKREATKKALRALRDKAPAFAARRIPRVPRRFRGSSSSETEEGLVVSSEAPHHHAPPPSRSSSSTSHRGGSSSSSSSSRATAAAAAK